MLKKTMPECLNGSRLMPMGQNDQSKNCPTIEGYGVFSGSDQKDLMIATPRRNIIRGVNGGRSY